MGRVADVEVAGPGGTAPSRSRRRRRPALGIGDSVAVDGVCLTARRSRTAGSRSTSCRRRSTARRSAGSRPRRGQRRAGPACRRSARRPLRPGSCRRGRHVRRSRPRATARASGSTRRPSSSATASRRARSRSTASRSPSPRSTPTDSPVALVPHTLAVTTLGRARARRRGEPRGRRAREVRREPAPRATISGDDAGRAGETERTFATIEEAIEDIREGKFVVVVDDGRPRERGRPDDRGPVRDARGDQLHGDARARPDLPLPDRGALRRARAPPMTERNETPLRHRVHGLDRGARGRHRPGSRRPTARARSRSRSTRRKGRTISSSPATSSRCARATAACCSARARPRRRSISRASRGSFRPASSARS